MCVWSYTWPSLINTQLKIKIRFEWSEHTEQTSKQIAKRWLLSFASHANTINTIVSTQIGFFLVLILLLLLLNFTTCFLHSWALILSICWWTCEVVLRLNVRNCAVYVTLHWFYSLWTNARHFYDSFKSYRSIGRRMKENRKLREKKWVRKKWMAGEMLSILHELQQYEMATKQRDFLFIWLSMMMIMMMMRKWKPIYAFVKQQSNDHTIHFACVYKSTCSSS